MTREHVAVDQRRRLGESSCCALGSLRVSITPPRASEIVRRGVERRRRLGEQRLQKLPSGDARRRRDRRGGAAAVGRRARRERSCRRCCIDDRRAARGRAFRRRLRDDRADAGADVLHARAGLDRPVAPSARTSMRRRVCTLAPQSDCAMPRPRLTGPGRRPAHAAATSRSARRRSAAPRAAPGSDRCGRAARADRSRASRRARRSRSPGARRPAYCRGRASRCPARR